MYTHTRVGWPSPVLYGHEVMTPAGDVDTRVINSKQARKVSFLVELLNVGS